jgi:hypothetical protein
MYQGLGLLADLTGLRVSLMAASARAVTFEDVPVLDMQVPLLLDASRRHAGDRVTLLLSDS